MTAQTTVEHTPTEVVHDLPLFPDMQIAEWQQLSVRSSDIEGVADISTTLIMMNNGARYIKRDMQPARISNPVRIEMMTPLGTRVKGANSLLGERVVAQSGCELSFVGCNQACGKATSLAQDVWAANLIMIEQDALQGLTADEQPVFSFGKSRGAMGSIGKMTYAELQGRSIALGFHEDPSLQHKTGPIETARKLTPLALAQEACEIARNLGRHRRSESIIGQIKRIGTMATTIGITPAYLHSQANSARAVWHGETGVFMQHLAAQQAIVTLMMNGNGLNHRSEFGQRNERLANSHVVDRDYHHMAMLRSSVEEAGVELVADGVRRLQDGEEPGSIARILAAQLELRLPSR